MTYQEMVKKGAELIHEHFLWILIALAVFVALYLLIHKLIMGSPADKINNKPTA